MFYIHQAAIISPQQSYQHILDGNLAVINDGQLNLIEPAYPCIPRNQMRRMSKAVRIGVGTAVACLQNLTEQPGIIVGTGYGGMEDSIGFLKQIKEYDEGLLTAGSFVQSTANAIAAQISLITGNRKYNHTHVHRGLAFENAMMDAALMLKENPGENYLVGGVDEISGYNFILESLAGLYKKEFVNTREIFESNTPGTIAGEGAAMFLVNDRAENAVAKLVDIKTLHTSDPEEIMKALKEFLEKNSDIEIDLLMIGENGDGRQLPYFELVESVFDEETPITRFKHLCGEYPTASAFGVWLSMMILKEKKIPAVLIKRSHELPFIRNILIYNCYNFEQHSFMIVGAM